MYINSTAYACTWFYSIMIAGHLKLCANASCRHTPTLYSDCSKFFFIHLCAASQKLYPKYLRMYIHMHLPIGIEFTFCCYESWRFINILTVFLWWQFFLSTYVVNAQIFLLSVVKRHLLPHLGQLMLPINSSFQVIGILLRWALCLPIAAQWPRFSSYTRIMLLSISMKFFRLLLFSLYEIFVGSGG